MFWDSTMLAKPPYCVSSIPGSAWNGLSHTQLLWHQWLLDYEITSIGLHLRGFLWAQIGCKSVKWCQPFQVRQPASLRREQASLKYMVGAETISVCMQPSASTLRQ